MKEERRKICIYGSFSFEVDDMNRMFSTREKLCEWMNTILTVAPLFRSYDRQSYVDVFVNADSMWTCTPPPNYSCIGCPYEIAKMENGDFYSGCLFSGCLFRKQNRRLLLEHCPVYTTNVCYQRGIITLNGYVRYSTIKAVKQQLTRNIAFLKDAGIRVYNISVKVR